MNFLSKSFFATVVVAALATVSNAQIVEDGILTINNLDVRVNGIFGHFDHVGERDNQTVVLNGGAPATNGNAMLFDPIIYEITYANIDLDEDGTANDTIDFTLRAETDGESGNQRIFGQGIDTGFGNLNGVTVTVSSVSGKTTDSDLFVVFDGFTGAEVGAGTGADNDLNRSVQINGTTVEFHPDVFLATGAFQFAKMGVDFFDEDGILSPVSSVLFDMSGGAFDTFNFDTGEEEPGGPGTPGTGSIVARTYDLQFSTSETQDLGAVTVPGVACEVGIGDLDGDGSVAFADFLVLSANFGQAVTDPALGDVDCDGQVAFADFLIFSDNFGSTTAGVATVPEPSSLLICGLGLVAIVSVRRRSA